MVGSLLLAVGSQTRNRKPNIELFSLVLPPLPAASPPKGGDETLEEKGLASWFPLWGERWCEAPKGACQAESIQC